MYRKMSIYNIYKDTFVYTTHRKIIFVYIAYEIFSLHDVEKISQCMVNTYNIYLILFRKITYIYLCSI